MTEISDYHSLLKGGDESCKKLLQTLNSLLKNGRNTVRNGYGSCWKVKEFVCAEREAEKIGDDAEVFLPLREKEILLLSESGTEYSLDHDEGIGRVFIDSDNGTLEIEHTRELNGSLSKTILNFS